MSARLLDGRAVASAIREAVLPDVGRFTASAGRPPGLGIVLVGDDPSSEIYVRNKVKAGAETGLWVDLQRSAGDRDPRRSAGARRAPERQRPARRDPGAGAVARGDGEAGRAARLRRDRSGQGRRRLPPDQRRTARAGPPAPCPVHAVRRDRHARALFHRDRAVARGRHRPQRYRREAHGHAAPAARRDGDHLPFEDS